MAVVDLLRVWVVRPAQRKGVQEDAPARGEGVEREGRGQTVGERDELGRWGARNEADASMDAHTSMIYDG